MELFQKYWYVVLIGFILLYLIFALFMHKKYAKRRDQFFVDHPTFAKVFIAVNKEMIYQTTVGINSVDNQTPIWHYTFGKQLVALEPGTHVLEATAEVTRPGVMHKSVKTVYGPVNLEITAEPGAEYELLFERKEQKFSLNKIN